MTYRGHIKQGVVVFDGEPPSFEEGTAVRVEAEKVLEKPARGSKEALLAIRHKIAWVGPIEELRALQKEVQQMRDEVLLF